MDNYLFLLPLDILDYIVSFIHNPKDLENLYKSNKYLFTNIIPRSVKSLWTNPDGMQYFGIEILHKYTKLINARIDIKITNLDDLIVILKLPTLKELCIRVSSIIDMSLIDLVQDLIIDKIVDTKKLRLERWSKVVNETENVWIGENKLCVANNSPFPYLVFAENWVENIIINNGLWLQRDYQLLLRSLPKLKHIGYIDHGYEVCTCRRLIHMITVNTQLESLYVLYSEDMYSIDPKKQWDEIDLFAMTVWDEVFPNIKKLILPFDPIDTMILATCFPNIKHIAFRWEFPLKVEDFFTIIECDSTELYKIVNNRLNKINIFFQKEINNYTLFLYLNYPNPRVRLIANRHPEKVNIISRWIKYYIINMYSHVTVIDMTNDIQKSFLTIDNWFFKNQYKVIDKN